MNFRELFGIDLPVIQAPMAGVQGSQLAIAVSKAGGLGSLPCGMLDTDTLRTELSAIQANTNKPFNVNFFCHKPPNPDLAREQQWQVSLGNYYEEYDIDPTTISSSTSRKPFDQQAAEILGQFKPPIVSFHFGLPSPELLNYIRSWNAKIMSTATTVEEAIWLEANGADIVIAQGLEAGGHRGMFLNRDLTTQMGTLALVSQIVPAIRLPVVAAGGIADNKGIAAVMKLGAVAAQIGTAYLLCPEATTRSVHRAALKRPEARHTAITNLFSGGAARGMFNRFMLEHGPMSDKAPPYPLASAAVAPLRTKAESQGKGDFSPLWAGQNTTGCKEIPAADLTYALCEGLV